jgi:hypothetical protein
MSRQNGKNGSVNDLRLDKRADRVGCSDIRRFSVAQAFEERILQIKPDACARKKPNVFALGRMSNNDRRAFRSVQKLQSGTAATAFPKIHNARRREPLPN